MTKRANSPPPLTADDIERLATAVDSLAHQVRHLALILDEVRGEVVYAVRNDPSRIDTWRPIAAAESPAEEDDESEPIAPPAPAPLPTPSPPRTSSNKRAQGGLFS